MTRARSEYRVAVASLAPHSGEKAATSWCIRPVADSDRDALAATLLHAYRGTIDDEGETEADAVAAIDDYYRRLVPEHSFVVTTDAALVALSFVVVVKGLPYIDPVATMASFKRQGVGRAAVEASLRSLASSGAIEVGAVITDGNTASVRLFSGLGFVRVGAWP